MPLPSYQKQTDIPSEIFVSYTPLKHEQIPTDNTCDEGDLNKNSCSVRQGLLLMLVSALVIMLNVAVDYRTKAQNPGFRLVDKKSIQGQNMEIEMAALSSPESGRSSERTTTNECQEMLVGVWIETCMVVSSDKADVNNNAFNGLEGVVTFPKITTVGDEKGTFEYYAYSLEEPFFGGEDFIQVVSGPISSSSLALHNHCTSSAKTRWKIGLSSEWNEYRGDYRWNQASSPDTVFSVGANGKSISCYSRRLLGNECRKARWAAIDLFSKVDTGITRRLLSNTLKFC